MSAAIFGLVGVVVGGVLSGVVTWVLDRNRAASASRAIARLTCDDFLHYQSTLVRALDANGWWDSAFLLSSQVSVDDRKLLLGHLDDELSQAVAGAQGWMQYLISRRESPAAAAGPNAEDLQAMRDTFCRLERARKQLATHEVSGWRFSSFENGAVLGSLPPRHGRRRTLEDLGISTADCARRQQAGYGRATEQPAKA